MISDWNYNSDAYFNRFISGNIDHPLRRKIFVNLVAVIISVESWNNENK